ncbi:hypothetical protein QTG54_014742, partial [Skeletonema marinoi]
HFHPFSPFNLLPIALSYFSVESRASPNKNLKSKKDGTHRRPRNRHDLHNQRSHRRHPRHLRQGMVQITHSSTTHYCIFVGDWRAGSLFAVGDCSVEEGVGDADESV